MKTVKLSEDVQLSVGKSAKFNSIQIELNKKRDDGRIRKAFLTPKSCKALLLLKDEIKSVAAVLRRHNDDDVEARHVEIPVDDKKAVTVSKWTENGQLQLSLQTIKDGTRQPALAFHLTEDEWNVMSEKAKDHILEVIDAQSAKIYDDDDRIKMYRWMTIKLDGSGVGAVGKQWEYVESLAREEAQLSVQPGEKVMLECKTVQPPTSRQLYKAAHIHLLTSAVSALKTANCNGCVIQHGSQDQHSYTGGCLDPNAASVWIDKAVATLSPMTVAELFHSVTSSLNLPDKPITTENDKDGDDDGTVEQIVVGDVEWKYPHLLDLCRKIQHRDTISLQQPSVN